MLLSDVFYEYREMFVILKNYSIKIENITNTVNQVLIENEENIITIDIDENEGYASLLIENKLSKLFYYTLSDYSYINGSKDIFDGVIGSINKDEFYREVKNYVKNQKKLGKRTANQIKLVKLIYALIDEFLKL